MELLTNWIGPRISQALADALEWKLRNASAAADGDAKFLDDGSSIRIKSSKKEFAQIIKIDDFSEPVQLWLSDARTKLKVVVAAEATFFPDSGLEYGKRQRVTDGTSGGLIQLIDYEIVAQPRGPNRAKLSMILKKLKPIGSNGSGVFGAPCHVESLEPVIEMLDRLQTIRAQELVGQPSTSFKPPKDIPSKDQAPSSSQTTGDSSVDDNPDKSQALFATQVPGLLPRKRLREGSLIVDENQPKFVEGVGTTRSTALTMGGTGDTPVSGYDSINPRRAEVLPLHVAQHDSSPPKGNQSGNHPESGPSPEEGGHVLDITTSAAEESMVKERHYALLNLLGLPNSAIQNQIQPRVPMMTPVHTHQGIKSPKRTLSATDKSTAAKVTPATTETHDSGMKSFRTSEKVNRVSKSPKVSTPPARFLEATQLSRKTLSRISGREVRIPKNQKDILDLSNSWCPPEPGKRAPVANVPISILQDLNNRAERRVRRVQGSSPAPVTPHSLRHDRSSQTASEIGGDNFENSNPDEPIPSADWPASSPERSVLPLDSSAEISEDPDEVDDQGTDSGPDSICATGVADNLSPSKQISLSVSLSSLSDSSKKRFLQSETEMKTRSSRRSTEISFSRRQLPRSSGGYSTTDCSLHKSSLDSSDAASKNLKENITDVQGLTARPIIPSLKSSKSRKLAVGDSSPGEENSSTNDDKAEAKTAYLDAFQTTTRSPDLHPHSNAQQIGTLLPSSKSMERSLPTHDHIDQQSSREVSPRIIRNAEAYSGSDSCRKMKNDSPDTDSDLETSIPHGLDRTIDIPSTFCVDQGPVLQVDRTPRIRSSLLKRYSAFSTEVNNGLAQDKALSREGGHNLSKSDDLSATAISILRQNALSEQDDNLEADVPISTIEETKLPPSIPSPRSTSPRIMQATKRKASEPVVLSPNVTKRRRAFRAGRAGSEHDSRNQIADPRDFGRQHRNEFFAQFSEKAHYNAAALDTPGSAKEESSDTNVASKNGLAVQNHTDEMHLGIKSEDHLRNDHALSHALHSLPHSPDVVHETRLEDSHEKSSHPSKIDRVDGADRAMQEGNQKDHDGLPTPPEPILQLRKCLIRSMYEGDIESLASQASNPEIAKWMSNAFPYPYRVEDAAKWISIATSASPILNFAICRPDDNTVIGGIGLKPKQDVSHITMQIGYWLGEEHWRRGIAKEAVSVFSEWTFEQFRHVLRLEAEVYEGNSSSVRVLENAGYAFEAKNRDAIEKMGVVRSVLVFCKFRGSEVSHEHKPSPNLVPVAEQSITGLFLTSEEDNAIKDPKIGASDLPKPRSLSDEEMRQAEHNFPPNLFDRFKIAYPEYPGNESQFAAICRKIGSLVRINSMEHPSLSDDFVVRHRTEYTQYLIQCNDEAVDPLPYERFYREKISQTKYSCSSGLDLTRGTISAFLPQEDCGSASSMENQSIPQSIELDDRVSAGSPTGAGRKMASNANEISKLLPDSGATSNYQVPSTKGANRLSSKTHPIGSTVRKQQSRPPSREKSFGSSSNDIRSNFSLGAEKLLQDLGRPKGGTKKEVIELTSGSEDEQPRPKTKRGRRSLPWTDTGNQPKAEASATVGTVASTSTPSVPKHGQQLPASISKPRVPKEYRPFAAFGSAKNAGQDDPIQVPTPSNHKPSKDKNAEKSTTKSSWIDDEHAPYKTWVRDYMAVTPGKGNSWAQDLSQGNGASKRKPKVKEKLVDPLSWEL